MYAQLSPQLVLPQRFFLQRQWTPPSLHSSIDCYLGFNALAARKSPTRNACQTGAFTVRCMSAVITENYIPATCSIMTRKTFCSMFPEVVCPAFKIRFASIYPIKRPKLHERHRHCFHRIHSRKHTIIRISNDLRACWSFHKNVLERPLRVCIKLKHTWIATRRPRCSRK